MRGSGTYGQEFRMRGRVVPAARFVPRPGDDLVIDDDHRANGNLSACGRSPRLIQRGLHEAALKLNGRN